MRLPLTVALALLACASGAENPSERNAWRVSVGPALIGGVRPRMSMDAGRMIGASGFASAIRRLDGSTAGRSKEDAYAAGSGVDGSGAPKRREFDDGAWYDPVDSAWGCGYDDGYSWNFRLHDPQGPDPDGLKGFTERTAYVVENESVEVSPSGGKMGDDSAECMPGVRLEASREILASEGERQWGVDVAAAVAYYFQRNVWKASGTAAQASVNGMHEEGHYEWWNDSHDEAQYILDCYRDTQFVGGMWGMGTFGGPGMELASDAWRVRDVQDSLETWSAAHTLRYHAKGDYETCGLELLVRPWWEPWEWLRIFASVGVEVAYREFEWKVSASGTDGSSFSERGREHDVGVSGLLGGGISLSWRDFSIAGEALWRFGGDDLKVDGRTVSGSVESGDWGLRLSIGYSF